MAENHILVAGKDGSATARFQNHLARYFLSSEGNFSAERVLNDENDRDVEKKWAALWSEGRFPEGPNQPKDFAYKVRPLGKHRDKPSLTVAFRDLSGACLSGAVDEVPVLPANPNENFVLVLLSDRTDQSGQDEALASLISGVKSRFGEEFAALCPVLLLASKAHVPAMNSQSIESFMTDAIPSTLSALQAWQARYTFGDFEIGELDYDANGKPLCHAPQFEDAAKIFRWIYFQFTRYPVVEPFLTRLWKSVRRGGA